MSAHDAAVSREPGRNPHWLVPSMVNFQPWRGGGTSKLDAAIARMSATLDSIDKSAAQLARKAAMAPMSSGGERNYVALP